MCRRRDKRESVNVENNAIIICNRSRTPTVKVSSRTYATTRTNMAVSRENPSNAKINDEWLGSFLINAVTQHRSWKLYACGGVYPKWPYHSYLFSVVKRTHGQIEEGAKARVREIERETRRGGRGGDVGRFRKYKFYYDDTAYYSCLIFVPNACACECEVWVRSCAMGSAFRNSIPNILFWILVTPSSSLLKQIYVIRSYEWHGHYDNKWFFHLFFTPFDKMYSQKQYEENLPMNQKAKKTSNDRQRNIRREKRNRRKELNRTSRKCNQICV